MGKYIIEIADEEYEFIKDFQSLIIGGRGSCRTIQRNIINAIKNGTPLPQGKWIPMNPDCRGYSDYFKCSRCGAYIYPNIPEKELDYNGCPYCFADMRQEESND